MKLILASNSPRRREILNKIGVEYSVIPSKFDERQYGQLKKERAKFFALSKAKDVYNSLDNKKDMLVLGADTIVCFEDEILEKPKDRQEAFNMLKKLSSNTHYVITGYALIGERIEICGEEVSKVTFNQLTDEYINEYIEKANPLDKAGSYGIQDGFNLVKEYEGSFDNIVGLPSEKISNLLKKIL